MRNAYKDAFLKKHNLKLGFMSPFVRATAFALQEQPIVNAVIDESEIIYRDYIDISVAVATGKGSKLYTLLAKTNAFIVSERSGCARPSQLRGTKLRSD